MLARVHQPAGHVLVPGGRASQRPMYPGRSRLQRQRRVRRRYLPAGDTPGWLPARWAASQDMASRGLEWLLSFDLLTRPKGKADSGGGRLGVPRFHAAAGRGAARRGAVRCWNPGRRRADHPGAYGGRGPCARTADRLVPAPRAVVLSCACWTASGNWSLVIRGPPRRDDGHDAVSAQAGKQHPAGTHPRADGRPALPRRRAGAVAPGRRSCAVARPRRRTRSASSTSDVPPADLSCSWPGSPTAAAARGTAFRAGTAAVAVPSGFAEAALAGRQRE